MEFRNPSASVCIPDGVEPGAALARVTHLGIGAHQDDLEIMAYHGIISCYHDPDHWFAGVTCTNGAGSARSGPYASFTDEAMQQVRRREQDEAAVAGRYAAMLQLGYPSSVVKDPGNADLRDDLVSILRKTAPDVVYTHNPADKHETHIGVTVAALQAIRSLPAAERPAKVYGCEVWRGLDWMLDSDKVALDVGAHDNLAASLVGLFDSQISGGKRYDLATMGRRLANATYFESHATDEARQLWFAMDLTPVAHDDSADLVDHVTNYLDRFSEDVKKKLRQRLGA